MKFYRYPLALVAYALLAIFVLAYAWNWLGDAAMETYWYYFPAGAAIYLLIAVLLSKLNIQWEWDVALQVACVLAPVLWYVNIKDPYKRPVYMFMVKSEYRGKIDVYFDHGKNAVTNANSTADTLYFKFDDNGEILLNEDVQYVKQCMHEHLYLIFPDKHKQKVLPAKTNLQAVDSTQVFLVDDSLEMEEGKVHVIHYRIK
ncbi:hypothetical protein BH11BAC7_BH11BAC7_29220 [soil metagenome]